MLEDTFSFTVDIYSKSPHWNSSLFITRSACAKCDNICSLPADDQQYEYSEDLGLIAEALYDYQAGETQSH